MLFLTACRNRLDDAVAEGARQFKRERELELNDRRHWSKHHRDRRRALRDEHAAEGQRGNFFEDSFAVMDGSDVDTSTVQASEQSRRSAAAAIEQQQQQRRKQQQPHATSDRGHQQGHGLSEQDVVQHHPALGRTNLSRSGYAVGTPRGRGNVPTGHPTGCQQDALGFGSCAGRQSARRRAGAGGIARQPTMAMGTPATTMDLAGSTIPVMHPRGGDSDDDDDDDTIAVGSSRPSGTTASGRPSALSNAARRSTGAVGEDDRRAVREQRLRLLEESRLPGVRNGGANARRSRSAAAAAASSSISKRRVGERDAELDSGDADAADSPVAKHLRSASADLGPYRSALSASIVMKASKAVAARVGTLVGVTSASVADRVRRAAARKCKPATGVIKAIKAQRPYTIPVALDDVDQQALLSLKRRGRDDLVINRLDFNIRTYQLRSLEGAEWANDQVINLYCAMVADRFPDRVATLGSFLYTKLNASGNPATLRNDALRWTLDKDVFALPKVLIVINDGVHWTLAVLNNQAARLEYFDSMGGAGNRVLDKLAAFFDAEYDVKALAIASHAERQEIARKRGPSAVPDLTKKQERRMLLKAATPLPAAGRPSTWPRLQPRKQIPQQSNGYDCGVFCSQFALCTALEVSLSAVAQADMGFIRKLMMLELLEGNFLHRF